MVSASTLLSTLIEMFQGGGAGIKYDGTVTFGNILTMVGLALAAFGAWYGLKGRVQSIESSVKQVDDKVEAAKTDLSARTEEAKADLTKKTDEVKGKIEDVEDRVSEIDKTLTRVDTSLGNFAKTIDRFSDRLNHAIESTYSGRRGGKAGHD